MHTARLAVAICLGALSLTIIAANWSMTLVWLKRKQSGSSIPIIGGLLGALGLAISPMKSLHAWWWAPLLVDIGCAAGFVAAGACGAVRWCKSLFSG